MATASKMNRTGKPEQKKRTWEAKVEKGRDGDFHVWSKETQRRVTQAPTLEQALARASMKGYNVAQI